jgi:SulP family sulfate permease
MRSVVTRTGLSGKIPINKSDGLAAITTGIANVPDGMASGVLAGVNPIYGVYTLMIGTPMAALGISTQLMMFNTTSAMTLVATDGLGSSSGEERVEALIAIALIAGVFQLALGMLGLGMIIKFVSNSVMTGFLTGISALIIMGQLWDLTGYVGEGGSKLEKTAQLMTNLRDVDIPTTV